MGFSDAHAAGNGFAQDEIMDWLFSWNSGQAKQD